MESKSFFLATSSGILLLSLAAIANASDCIFTDWAQDAPTCEADTNLVFEMVVFNERSASCCKPGSAGEKEMEESATSCRVSRCVPRSQADPCSTALPYETFYKGKKVIYEEVNRESCTMGLGSQGVAAYCCRKGSLESALASKMGAEPHEFPHMALIKLPGDQQCGGTIYNKRWIMTAAHCIVDRGSRKLRTPNNGWRAKVGRNVGSTEMRENDYKIIRAIPHPEFSKLEGHPNLEAEFVLTFNDAAFLEVDRDIVFGPNVKALPIAPAGFDELKYADTAVIVGWGITDTLQISENLLKANAIIRSDKACFILNDVEAGPHFFQFNRTEQLICVGGILDGKWSNTAGEGDSGGPAICRDANGFAVLCGITSYGGSDQNCSKYNNELHCPPSVYVEVDHFRDFINQTAGDQDESTFHKVHLYGEVVNGPKYEHQVHITSKTGKSCGGTLITPDTVITAGQCVAVGDGSGKTHPEVQVWSGVQDISPGSGKLHAVKSIVLAEGFNRSGEEIDIGIQGNRIRMTDQYHNNDLAVIKLKEPVLISLTNLPRLPEEDEVATDSGLEYAFPRNTSRGGELRQREFKILDKDDCQRRMDRLENVKLNVTVDKELLCGVEKFSGGSQCDRELGGGLICEGKNGTDILCGIQVFRLCEWAIPNGFLDIAQFSRWIKATIAQ
ncbi:unnamed protein product [Orchesella dallaii]|uniref:Peptidase S1 domain-containing protein n=1 Tax=Orchesella dallaii TaxID=48710 RepID=A0ABP1S0K8_9HEXA